MNIRVIVLISPISSEFSVAKFKYNCASKKEALINWEEENDLINSIHNKARSGELMGKPRKKRFAIVGKHISNPGAILEVDSNFKWYSQVEQTKCECGLRIYKIDCDRAVVIVSELKNNPGRSIKEEALTLIHLVCCKFELNLSKTMWIEYYPQKNTYNEIKLAIFYTHSKRINKEQLEALLKVKV